MNSISDDADDEEILSTSTTGRLWKCAFNRRGGQKFLDICLLKKAYMKALEEVFNDEQDKEIVTELLTSMVDQTVTNTDNEKIEESCETNSTKRSNIVMEQTHRQQMKRIRAEYISTYMDV